MKKNLINLLIIGLIPLFMISCKSQDESDKNETDSIDQITDEKHVVTDEMLKSNTVTIKTEFGTMKVMLYDKTPKHKENFIKLAAEGFFNDLLFHRVINEFMIQGGDPDSKGAESGEMLGNGGPGYQIPAEFNDSLFHFKGVIAAAREGDQVNPEKKSSGSQFYIVQGKTYTDEELNEMEEGMSVNNYIMSHPEIQEKLGTLQMNQDQSGIDALIEDIKKKKDFEFEKLPEFKREKYKEIGGTPFLDDNYTVFGEVIEGLEVIDKIASVITDQNNRPINDVKMKVKVVVE